MSWKSFFGAAAFIVLLLLVILLSCKSCGKEGNTTTIIHEKRDTIYVRQTDTVTVNKIYKEPSKIDTFFVFNELHDTLFISGIAVDTINIDSLVLELVSNYPVITDSIFIESVVHKKEKYAVYVGADAGVNMDRKFDIGARIGVSIDRHSVEAGYDFLNRQFVIGYRFKIIRKEK